MDGAVSRKVFGSLLAIAGIVFYRHRLMFVLTSASYALNFR